jgi:glycosyltransferase involved in cell wall biosynthesis
MKPGPKISFVHDWLVTYGGGEKTLAAMMEVWPEAPVYTLVHDPDGPCRGFTQGKIIHTSFIQKLPGAKRNHRLFLPLMPLAVEQYDLSAYDLVISSSHAVSKGALTQADQLHICYIYTPMRYAWDLQQTYLREAGLERGVKGMLARALLHYIRLWDVATTNRVDDFVSISEFTARRVKKIYQRESRVIYPPVDIRAFQALENHEDFYLTVSRLVPYKKIDLIVETFNQLKDRRLVIIGEGPERKRLEALAGPNIQFLGFQSDEAVCGYMRRARAFLFAALEDFGIVPVEAQACGTPVIAYGKGGSLETVIDGVTGLFFAEQTAENLAATIRRFESGEHSLNVAEMRANAERFSRERFQREMHQYVEQRWSEFEHRSGRPGIASL